MGSTQGGPAADMGLVVGLMSQFSITRNSGGI